MTRDHLAFGVTVDQIDQFNSLLRTITATGDVVAVGSAQAVHPQTVSTLGEAIFNAAPCGTSSIRSANRNSDEEPANDGEVEGWPGAGMRRLQLG